MRRQLGDGTSTLFRWNCWIDREVLKVRFSRLFDLSNSKMATVAEIKNLNWTEGREV